MNITNQPVYINNPIIKLKDIYVKSHNDTFVKIKDHPYYISLDKDNKDAYLQHVKGSAFQLKNPLLIGMYSKICIKPSHKMD